MNMESLFIFITSYVFLCVCLSNVQGNKCPGPNEYYSCGGACDNVCETLHIMNQTHCPIINIKCNEMCYCKEGYARDANNICVPFKECQPSPVQQGRKRRDTILNTEGYLRLERDTPCRPMRECPEFADETDDD